jgi:pimeloyl-ACP methyl ester carboxylesterase
VSKSQLWLILGAMLASTATLASVEAQSRSDVVIADRRLTVATTAGSGLLRIFLSADWTQPREEVTRVVVIFHGAGRNAVGYFKTALKARELAGEQGVGAMIIAPHFLETADLERNPPADAKALLRWKPSRWKHGWPASAPAPLSSFDAIDAIVDRLADRTIFPKLGQVVLAGHSAGGQILQRYAVVGPGAPKLSALGIHVRYVVANPSSYAYFSKDRPGPSKWCSGVNDWGYGMNKRPPYAAKGTPGDFERAYVGRDIVYLLGAEDIHPSGEDIDTSCAAEAQGECRLDRGHAYFVYMQERNPGITHRLHEVPDAGHSAGEMFKSECGVGVLFDRPGCDSANIAQLRTTAASRCAKRSN